MCVTECIDDYIQRKVQNYDAVRMFIGENKKEYFCIINAAQKKKYVLPIIQGMTKMDLLIFQSKFEQGTLEQFLASQEPQIQPYKPCRKLVSRDLSQFLDSQTPVKVIYLYTAHQTCEICAEMLNLFAELAQNMYDEKVVGFGYYDIFANDHPKITDEIVPYFLIFQNLEEQPIGVPAENMEDLYDMIIQVVMKDVPIPEKSTSKRQKQNSKKFNEREHEVQLDDINLDQLSDIEAEDLDYDKLLDDNLQDL